MATQSTVFLPSVVWIQLVWHMDMRIALRAHEHTRVLKGVSIPICNGLSA